MILAGYALGAEIGYIFLRREYHLSAQRLNQAIAEAYAEGYLGKPLPGRDFNLICTCMVVLAGGPPAAEAVTFYVIVYCAMSLGAFGVVTVYSSEGGDKNRFEDYEGLF